MGAPVIRFDIGCRDREKTVAFYEKVFGWTPKEAPFNTEMETGAGRGIDGAVTALGHEPHNYVMIYMEVADVNAGCNAIRAAGGKVTVGPVEIPAAAPGGGGKFAWFTDPEGNQLAIFEPPSAS
ncbi:VOC family protein [Hyphococcus sp.]|uniref:VOC family protein n=1 Tax=Hyphococcus sp. TaxID=2038636 RepID=UPI003D14D005